MSNYKRQESANDAGVQNPYSVDGSRGARLPDRKHRRAAAPSAGRIVQQLSSDRRRAMVTGDRGKLDYFSSCVARKVLDPRAVLESGSPGRAVTTRRWSTVERQVV